MMREIRPLTGLRGIAALYVLVFHYFPLEPMVRLRNPLLRVLDHGYLAVDIFFVLSGFVMAMNYAAAFADGPSAKAYLRFLGRRIARIYPLYLVATLIGFAFVSAGWLRYPYPFDHFEALGLSALMIQAWGFTGSFDSPAWSISAEWAAYLLFPLLVLPTLFAGRRWAWTAAVACFAALAILCALPASMVQDYNIRQPLNFNGYWLALPVWRCLPEFCLGLLAYRLSQTERGRNVAANGWIAGTVCILIVVCLATPKADFWIVALVPALIVALCGESHLPGRLLASAPAQLAGRLSYSIYLTHKLLLGLADWIWHRAHAAGIPHAQTVASGLCIALTFPLAYLAYRAIELPARRRLRALFEHKHPVLAPQTAVETA